MRRNEITLVDARGEDYRFSSFPENYWIENASIGYYLKIDNDGLEGIDKFWHLTFKGAERHQHELVGNALMNDDMRPKGEDGVQKRTLRGRN